MKSKLLLLFIAFSLRISAQHYVGVETLLSKQIKYAGAEYLYKANKVLYFGAGIGCQFKDSLYTTYDISGDRITSDTTLKILAVPLTITVRTDTKKVYGFLTGKNLLSINKPISLIGVLGIGYEYKKFRTQLGISFYKLAPGISYEAGFTF
jgi:hypothetical protein